MSNTTIFKLTQDHLKLLQRFHVYQGDFAPEIDQKRPYGNSYIEEDVANILGWKYDSEFEMPVELEKRAWKIHKETSTALQIVLATQKFEVGTYILQGYDPTKWRKIEDKCFLLPVIPPEEGDLVLTTNITKTSLTLKIIESYGFPKRTRKPDWDDVVNIYTLPNGLELSYLAVSGNEPTESDALEGLDGYIYINTKEELDNLLSKTLHEIREEFYGED